MPRHKAANWNGLTETLKRAETSQNRLCPFFTQLCHNNTTRPIGYTEEIMASNFNEACAMAANIWEGKIPPGISYMVWGTGGSIKLIMPIQ
jgi:hypothetical protein